MQGGKQNLFSKAALIDDARRRARVAGNYPLESPALDALLASMHTAADAMNLMGCRRARRMLIDVLVKRLRLADYLEREPAIRDITIRRPIFLVGPPRSGTTFLHRLLAQDPAHRTPRLWEVMQAPPPEPEYRNDPAYFQKDYRVALAAKLLEARARFSPRMAAIHATEVNAPEECFGLLETTLHSHSFLFCAPVFDYLDWLDNCDNATWRSVYAMYADQLRLLQWWHAGDRWLLKTPFHLWAMDALCATFPDALVVQQHRDPLACAASFCSLTQAAFATTAGSVSKRTIGRTTLRYLRDALARNVQARRTLPPKRFIDIRYNELIADPMAVAQRVYDAAHIEPSAAALENMRAWLPEQAKSRSGSKHDYRLEDFGLSEDAVLEAFAPYSALLEPGQA